MSVLLPAVVPSGRTLSGGQFAMVRKRFLSGTPYRRLYGKLRFNLRLQLAYGGQGGIPGDQAALFWAAWNQATTTEAVILAPETLAGMSSSLQATIPTDLNWVFSGPPTITPTVPGWSTVSLELLQIIPD